MDDTSPSAHDVFVRTGTAELHVRFLGDGAVFDAQAHRRVTFPTRKALGVLAYVALRRQRVTREEIARLLWKDVPPDQSRHSLRQALYQVRHALGRSCQDVLVCDCNTIELDEERVRVDVWAFEEFVHHQTADSLRRARRLYRGDLLPALWTRERLFDRWLATERTRLRLLAADAGCRGLHSPVVHVCAPAAGAWVNDLTGQPLLPFAQ